MCVLTSELEEEKWGENESESKVLRIILTKIILPRLSVKQYYKGKGDDKKQTSRMICGFED